MYRIDYRAEEVMRLYNLRVVFIPEEKPRDKQTRRSWCITSEAPYSTVAVNKNYVL